MVAYAVARTSSPAHLAYWSYPAYPAGLTVIEENGTILITSPTKNPFSGAAAKPGEPVDAESRAFLEPMTKGFRVASRINAPFEILEHNATRREGTTLIWEIDFAAIEKGLNGGPMPSMRVRYRTP
jgi:hypothetical protein